ncbi:predicted protein [Naegleria gruberi]|uniref:Predicted protein n=1 Tax=Naegleria gruberi TaxID=5762 RepID=D2W5E4_NAEGR|nr:uncharacterized protein NAEGRDRAFT_76635 [Naegleria gruberi]EFC35711.1 predicted protein [Naegleria gruberi]|eukprot:XP_002668455.1 predicted protein [Naegleria gruberi strain NEG-M]
MKAPVLALFVLFLMVVIVSARSAEGRSNKLSSSLLRDRNIGYKRDLEKFQRRIDRLKEQLEFFAESDSEGLSERDFLRKFYLSTGGHYWRNNTGWNTMDTGKETNFCSWYGVKCIGNQYNVLSLNLARNNLTGVLPTGIADSLQSVMIINLAFNAIGGQIPKEYGEIPSLTGIHLGSNHFEGLLPSGLCRVLSCDCYNNPKLLCPADNCNNNHCNMAVCNCGGLTMCNSDADCYGKLCSRCVSNGSPFFKICK